MKQLILLVAVAFLSMLQKGNAAILIDTVPKKIGSAAGIWYCSDFEKTKYKVVVSEKRMTITRQYKQYVNTYTANIRKGKIFSNDPNEEKLKDLHGKYYRMEGKNFGVLNVENGDYDWFTECKH